MQDATGSWGSLTGLLLVAGDESRSEHVPSRPGDREFCQTLCAAWQRVVWSVVEAFGDWIVPLTMLRFEQLLQERLRDVGRLIVEHVVNRIEPESPHELRPEVQFDGEWYRRRQKTPLRNLNCLFGPIALRRCLYQPSECPGRCLFPLERQLGILGGVATPALADEVARGAVDHPQRQVLDSLKERHGVRWSAQTLRKVVAAVDELYTPQRHEAQVEKLLGWLRAARDSRGKHAPVLSVGRDGLMLPVVRRDKYQEGATATVSVYDRQRKRLGTVYLGHMPEAGQETLSELLTRVLSDVLTRWDGPTPRLNYVTDCGHHPTQYFETVLARMRDPRRPDRVLRWEWIADYYHACEYLSQLAESLFGPGRAAFAWAKKQRQVLLTKDGGVFRVLRSAGALRTSRGLIGNESDYYTASNYLRNHAAHMNYATARRRGLPIGSGVTEAGCKTLFTQRFKQSGMKWSLTGGQPILNLRTIALSGIWPTVRDHAWQSYEIPQPPTHTAKLKSQSRKPRILAV